MVNKTTTKAKPKKKVVKKVEKAEVVEPKALQEMPVAAPANFKGDNFTKEQIELIKTTIAKGASDDELKLFLYTCERTKLDPFARQIYLIPRWDGKTGKEVRGVITGIDGLRSIAERTGNYAGNNDPVLEGEIEVAVKGIKVTAPLKATSTVKKIVAGVPCEFTASADWSEYYPGDTKGFMWRKMPKVMLGKCAEAKALRKAFPQVMSGLYVVEEMDQAQEKPAITTKDVKPEVITNGPAKPLEEKTDSPFQKAKEVLQKSEDIIQLQEFREGLKKSKKYHAGEKVSLDKVAEDRIKELTATPQESEKDDGIPVIND